MNIGNKGGKNERYTKCRDTKRTLSYSWLMPWVRCCLSDQVLTITTYWCYQNLDCLLYFGLTITLVALLSSIVRIKKQAEVRYLSKTNLILKQSNDIVDR